jgi:hypothetical protein
MKICEKLVRLTPNAKEKTASEASQSAITADKKRKKRFTSGAGDVAVVEDEEDAAGSVANEEKSL